MNARALGGLAVVGLVGGHVAAFAKPKPSGAAPKNPFPEFGRFYTREQLRGVADYDATAEQRFDSVVANPSSAKTDRIYPAYRVYRCNRKPGCGDDLDDPRDWVVIGWWDDQYGKAYDGFTPEPLPPARAPAAATPAKAKTRALPDPPFEKYGHYYDLANIEQHPLAETTPYDVDTIVHAKFARAAPHDRVYVCTQQPTCGDVYADGAVGWVALGWYEDDYERVNGVVRKRNHDPATRKQVLAEEKIWANYGPHVTSAKASRLPDLEVGKTYKRGAVVIATHGMPINTIQRCAQAECEGGAEPGWVPAGWVCQLAERCGAE